MATKYLSKQEIGHITHMCEHLFTNDAKETLKRLEKEYNIIFTLDKKTNVNLLWRAYGDALMTSTRKDIRYNKTYAEASKALYSPNIEARDILSTHIEYNHKEDYEFIWSFEINDLMTQINSIVRQAGGQYHSENLQELLYCKDYNKLFTSLYGIDTVDKKALQATKKAVQFFDELLAEIPNKEIFFTELAKYYHNNNLAELHNTLHNTDY